MAGQLQTAYYNAFEAKEQLAEVDNALLQLVEDRIKPIVDDTDGTNAPIGDTLYEEYDARLKNYQQYLQNFQSAVSNYTDTIEEHEWGTANSKEDAFQLNELLTTLSEKLDQMYENYQSLLIQTEDGVHTADAFPTHFAELQTLRDQIWQYSDQANQYQNEDFEESLKIRDVTAEKSTLYQLGWGFLFVFGAPVRQYKDGEINLKQLALVPVQLFIFVLILLELVSFNLSGAGAYFLLNIFLALFSNYYLAD